MNKTEIQRLLDVSLVHSVVIDVRDWPETPGNLRTVTIYQDYHVAIEFERSRAYTHGDIEGCGLKYVGRYDDLDALVNDLEEFLEKPVESWSNFTETPYVPTIGAEPDWAKNLAHFEDTVRRGAVRLPRGVRYGQADPYFRHIAKYGTFRKDKVFEEQEEELGLGPDDEEGYPVG